MHKVPLKMSFESMILLIITSHQGINLASSYKIFKDILLKWVFLIISNLKTSLEKVHKGNCLSAKLQNLIQIKLLTWFDTFFLQYS